MFAMKTLRFPSRISLTLALVAVASLPAQSAAQPPPLGLLRLKSNAKPTDAAPLVADKF